MRVMVSVTRQKSPTNKPTSECDRSRGWYSEESLSTGWTLQQPRPTFLLNIVLPNHGKFWFLSHIFPHIENNVSSDHRELYDEREEIDRAVLDGVAENVNLVTMTGQAKTVA